MVFPTHAVTLGMTKVSTLKISSILCAETTNTPCTAALQERCVCMLSFLLKLQGIYTSVADLTLCLIDCMGHYCQSLLKVHNKKNMYRPLPYVSVSCVMSPHQFIHGHTMCKLTLLFYSACKPIWCGSVQSIAGWGGGEDFSPNSLASPQKLQMTYYSRAYRVQVINEMNSYVGMTMV